MIFEEKCFSCYVLLTDQMSLSGFFYFVRNWAICVLYCLITRLRHHKFWKWPYGSNRAVFSTWTKIQDKNLNILGIKRTFNPLSANPTKWPNTLNQFVGKLPMNCLSVFGHFINMALKGLRWHKKHFPSLLKGFHSSK